MTEHARLSPSAYSRWSACPGSVAATDGLPRRSSEFAAEGTVLHEVAALCLEFGFEPHDFIGQTMSADGFSFTIDEDHADCIVPGLDWLREQPGDVYIEHRVSLSPWLEDQFGTLDVGIWDAKSRTCTIFDWKFGAGVPVAAVGNDQLRLYAVGFFETILKPRKLVPDTFRIVIQQPRCPGGGGEWSVSLGDLMEFAGEASVRGARALEPNAPRIAGEKQCYWCEAKSNCPVYDTYVLDIAGMKFEDLDAEEAPDLPELTPERRSYVVKHSKMFEDWLARQHASALSDALAGLPTPGLKVVQGRAGRRAWRDETDALSLLKPVLGDQSVNMKVISPADAEKVLKPKKTAPGHPETWDAAQRLIYQPDPKPALVPEDDARPALRPAVAHFDNVEDSSPETP